jgi:ABC-type bacteriocin/lantibiotic exporter with double-glycine peptidase domain
MRKEVPFVAQLEKSECGVTAITMVLAYHGRVVPRREMRRVCRVSRTGVSVTDILEAAAQYDLDGVAVRVAAGKIGVLPLPAILHVRGSHFVVLERVNAARVTIVDPQAGRVSLTWKEFKGSFGGIALVFAPNRKFRPTTA